ncbi:MAG TPA: hypothetical protein DCE42_15780 [Myxococcales bacterium]|nr:hypothetical protein [Deltaproteobacteria bacterium]MBU53746.1 hypothetical protein [Deltaproteobacteria bacterium]HAA56224.1 hypothetical protein [Myxococcales bacterium]|tara:strand:+ start:420 stop:1046 length:627 start_codon:yes stop_codon:yes gene_type:complete
MTKHQSLKKPPKIDFQVQAVLSTDEYVTINAMADFKRSEKADLIVQKLSRYATELFLEAAVKSQLTQTVVLESIEEVLEDELNGWLQGVYLNLFSFVKLLEELPAVNRVQIKLFIATITRLVREKGLPFQLRIPPQYDPNRVSSTSILAQKLGTRKEEHIKPPTLRRLQSARVQPGYEKLYSILGAMATLGLLTAALWWFLGLQPFRF